MEDLIERLRDGCAGCQNSLDCNVNFSRRSDCVLRGKAADAIEKLEAENKELYYTLEGVMHSVDKWLDDVDYTPNKIQRAATMRENTLQIVEALQVEND